MTLSKDTGILGRWGLADFLTTTPAEVAGQLNAYQAVYNLEWDDKHLYGKVQVHELTVDNRYPDFPAGAFLDRSAAGFFPDLLYDSVVLVVEDSTSQSAGYTTEMHLFIRPPEARSPQWTFFGRTTDEEDFSPLTGTAVACPGTGGYTVMFAVAWLPSRDWQPRIGAQASVRLIAPLPTMPNLSMEQRATANAYLLARMVDITLAP
jgi:hypothetical protein